jgi:prevent-host-death family protein
MSRTLVTAREANQSFSALLGKVISGETVIITKHGEPVATLAPYQPEAASAARAAAWDRLLARLEKGVTIGISDGEARAWVWDRNSLYDDEDGNPRGMPRP